MNRLTTVMQYVGLALLATAFLYMAVAGIAWQFRNPLANQTTVWTYFPDVMAFNKLDEFQPRKDVDDELR